MRLLRSKHSTTNKVPWFAASLVLIVVVAGTFFVHMLPAYALDGLQGYWKFDELSGTAALDSSGNDNEGVITNGSYNDEEVAPTDFANPSSILLNGDVADENDGGYITVPDDDSLDIDGDMTAMAWVYWNGAKPDPIFFNDDHTLFFKDSNYHYIVKQDGQLQILNSGGWVSSEASLQPNEWSLVTFVVGESGGQIYINDDLVGEGGSAVGATNSEPLYIGRDPSTRFFNGFIDEARIYDYALEAADIQDIAAGEYGPAAEPTFAGGDGSEETPWQVASCEQLQNIDENIEYWDDHFELVDDIDCSRTNPGHDDFDPEGTWGSGKGFDPIGNDEASFTGRFDGKNNVIEGLFIQRADDEPGAGEEDESYVGLFKGLDEAIIEDVELADTYVRGLNYVGGIAGFAEDSAILRSSVNENVSNDGSGVCDEDYCIWARYGEYGGGIVGGAANSLLEDVHTGGPVKGSGTIIGGLAGVAMEGSVVVDSSSSSAIDGGYHIGGLVGYLEDSSIDTSYATGDVETVYDDGDKIGNRGGGLVGAADSSTISDSYATGDVFGNSEIGGLVGFLGEDTDITRSYATGNIGGRYYVGGFVGYVTDQATISESFATGDVEGEDYNIGGFGGEIVSGRVEDSYATGNAFAGDSHVGGFFGTIYGGTVQRNYATGDVTIDGEGSERAGAFAGEVYEDAGDIVLTDSFATGNVSAPASTGGFIANLNLDGMTFSNNIFDVTRTGQSSCTGTGEPLAQCTGVNADDNDSDYFFNTESNDPFGAWDFTEVWETREFSYPCLIWETDETCKVSTPNITTCEELQNIRNNLTGSYTLENDLDCAFTPEATVYSEDFEEGQGDWTTGGDDSTWHLETESCVGEDMEEPFEFESNVMGSNGNAGPDCEFDHEETSYLMSPVISLPDVEKLNLEVDSYAADESGDCEDDYDNKSVAVTTNGGSSFTILNDCYRLHTYPPEGMDYRQWRFDLSDFAGQEVQIMFNYDTEDGCCEEDLGWFVDNMKVYEGGTLFYPIGSDEDEEDEDDSESNLFSGSFDGQDHTISNLYITASQEGVGLFGGIDEEGAVSDVTLENATISNPGDETGALAGINYGEVHDVHIINPTVRGGDDSTGGLIGENVSDVTDSSVHGGEVMGSEMVGGLVGYNDNGDVAVTSATATVTGSDEIGGLVGDNDGVVQISFAEGDVSGEGDEIGGLIGSNEGLVADTYATGDVRGNSYIGGLVGHAEEGETSQVESSYATGNVEGQSAVGGFIGYLEGGSATDSFAASDVSLLEGEDSGDMGAMFGVRAADQTAIASIYYDMERSLTFCENDGEEADPEGCTGVNGENSQPNYFFNNNVNPPLDAWDFEGIWLMHAGTYPTFQEIIDEGGADSDDDGISDATENAGPNGGDANGDGTPDSEQPHVASFVNPETGEYSVLDVSEECTISRVTIVSEAEVSSQRDAGFDYPAGLMDFSIDCGEEGFTATITQLHNGVTGDFTIRKFRPDSGYFAVEDTKVSDETIGDQQVKVAEYRITDGELYDIDDELNGIIEDPAGLAAQVVGVPNTGLRR